MVLANHCESTPWWAYIDDAYIAGSGTFDYNTTDDKHSNGVWYVSTYCQNSHLGVPTTCRGGTVLPTVACSLLELSECQHVVLEVATNRIQEAEPGAPPMKQSTN